MPSSQVPEDDAVPEAPVPEAPAARRARLDRVFGDVLPEIQRDERGSAQDERASEEELRRNVPPHHG
jgi:hypothetical protein